jgi:chromosome segregation ATPase
MNPPNHPTPRTDAAWSKTFQGELNQFWSGNAANQMRDECEKLERELTETERLRFGADADRRQLRCDLSDAKAEASHYMAVAQKATDELIFFRADNLKAHQMTCAAGLERDQLRAENESSCKVLRQDAEHNAARAEKAEADVERWKTVAAKMSEEREHNANEASRLRALSDQLSNNLSAVGAAYNAEKARAEKAEAELADWCVLKGWGGEPEIVHKFIKGQQTRIHHCQDLEAELITERARLDYLDLQMGMPQVSEALNLPFSQCFPIRDAIDRAMKNETNTP